MNFHCQYTKCNKKKSKYQQYFHCFFVCILVILVQLLVNIITILISLCTYRCGAYQREALISMQISIEAALIKGRSFFRPGAYQRNDGSNFKHKMERQQIPQKNCRRKFIKDLPPQKRKENMKTKQQGFKQRLK